MLAAALGTGCAVDDTGLLAAQVVQGDGGYAVTVHSLGLHLNTREETRGLSVGYQQTTYVFPDAGAPPAEGWYFWRAPLPDRLAVSTQQQTAGVALDLSEDIGITLGYRARTVMARIPADSDVVLHLAIDYADLASLDLSFDCQGGSQCE